MVKRIVAGLCIGIFFVVAFMPDSKPIKTEYSKTLAEYNNQRYLDYLGEEPEPFIVTYVEPVIEPEFIEDDIKLMARVVMSEASVLPIDGKQAVAATIINRVRSDKFPDNVHDVVYAQNQYSTADNGDPNEDCYTAVYAAIEYDCFPDDMYYFRRDYYHSFGYPYCQIKNTYFSTEGKN